MKRGTKGLLKAALTMTILGAAFCIAALCLGFSPRELEAAVEEGKFELVGSEKMQRKVTSIVKDATEDSGDFEQAYTSIDSLDLNIGVADCELIMHEGDELLVKGYDLPSSFSCRQNGDTLKIECEVSGWQFWQQNNDAVLELYIPSDLKLKEVKLDCGVGTIESRDGFFTCDELEVDMGVGDCSFWADIREKADIDGGVGNLELTLNGDKEDFNYDIDCGIGEITIGDETFSNLGEDQKINHHADKEIEIDCGIGEVEIAFEE